MHRLLALHVVLGALVVGSGLVRPLPADAVASDGEPFADRPVAGTSPDGTEFLGTLFVHRFARVDG